MPFQQHCTPSAFYFCSTFFYLCCEKSCRISSRTWLNCSSLSEIRARTCTCTFTEDNKRKRIKEKQQHDTASHRITSHRVARGHDRTKAAQIESSRVERILPTPTDKALSTNKISTIREPERCPRGVTTAPAASCYQNTSTSTSNSTSTDRSTRAGMQDETRGDDATFSLLPCPEKTRQPQNSTIRLHHKENLLRSCVRRMPTAVDQAVRKTSVFVGSTLPRLEPPQQKQNPYSSAC